MKRAGPIEGSVRPLICLRCGALTSSVGRPGVRPGPCPSRASRSAPERCPRRLPPRPRHRRRRIRHPSLRCRWLLRFRPNRSRRPGRLHHQRRRRCFRRPRSHRRFRPHRLTLCSHQRRPHPPHHWTRPKNCIQPRAERSNPKESRSDTRWSSLERSGRLTNHFSVTDEAASSAALADVRREARAGDRGAARRGPRDAEGSGRCARRLLAAWPRCW